MYKNEYMNFCYENIFDSTEHRYCKYYLLVDSCLGFISEYIEAKAAMTFESYDRIVEEFGDVCFFYSILENELNYILKNEKEMASRIYTMKPVTCIDLLRKFIAKNDLSSLMKLNLSVKAMFAKLLEEVARLLSENESDLLSIAQENNVEKIKKRYGEQK